MTDPRTQARALRASAAAMLATRHARPAFVALIAVNRLIEADAAALRAEADVLDPPVRVMGYGR